MKNKTKTAHEFHELTPIKISPQITLIYTDFFTHLGI